MQPVWRVEMLGGLRLVGNDAAVARFRTRRVAVLLARLAFAPMRAYSREELAELLWPAADPTAARRNLRQALTSLRHALEPPGVPGGSILLIEGDCIRLNPQLVHTDAGDFEDLSARDPGAAAALYKGELLPGFAEDWIELERFRINDLYVSVLNRLSETDSPQGSLATLRRALEHDRLNEELHVDLMRRYLEAGRPDAALRQYDDLRRQLREHLNERPGPAARDLRRRAKRTDPTPIPAPPMPVEAEPERVVRLPVNVSRFCGREDDLARAIASIADRRARLTTLHGPAGAGKTRLAVEVGRRLAESGNWNVWFVPLADASDAAMVADAILEVTRARASAGPELIDRLRAVFLDRPHNLLILDNLEHITEAAAPIVADLVQRLPEAQVLVTTRQLLMLEAEQVIPVPPLPTPENRELSPAELAAFPSVQIFVDRAQVVRPDFQLTPHNARAIAAICAKLEGIPLAIELAAGLTGAFPPSQLVHHLERRLTALASRRRDTPVRHRSLRAAIDYSYETLSPDLQRFFVSLSVFRGGFTIPAAAAVCRMPSEGVALDAILQLQERSLLRSEAAEEDPELRFRMLEAFREYGEEVRGADDLRESHARYFLSQPPPSVFPPNAEEITRRHLWIENEHENFIAALDHFVAQGALEEAIGSLDTLASTWAIRGPRAVERAYIRRIADRLDERPIDPNRQILLLRMLGTTYIRSMEYAAAKGACERALAIAEAHDLKDQLPVCFSAIATCAGYLGDLSLSKEMCERVLEEVGEMNLPLRERALLGIGAVHWGRAELEEADRAYRAAAEVSSRHRGGEPNTLILLNIARVGLDLERFDDALVTLGSAMRICQRLRDDFGQAACLSLFSRYHWLTGNLSAAVANGYEALVKFREADFAHYSLVGLFQQGLVLASLGEWESATILFGATQGIGKAARLLDERDHTAAVQTIRKHLGDAAYERARAKGLVMDVESAFRLALRFR